MGIEFKNADFDQERNRTVRARGMCDRFVRKRK